MSLILVENYKEIKEYGDKASKILIGKVKATQEGDEGEEGGHRHPVVLIGNNY